MSAPRTTGDDGVTLAELQVALVLMATALTLFTAAVLPMFRTANRIESISTAQSQLHTGLQRLDKEIRYAVDVTDAAAVDGIWYVEWLTVVGGVPICTEMRLQAGQLQRRTWTENKVDTTRTGWLPLASHLRPAGTAAPFALLPPDASVGFERLRLRLAAVSGAGGSAGSAETDITFTALNTSRDGTVSTCTEGRSRP